MITSLVKQSAIWNLVAQEEVAAAVTIPAFAG